jgi:argininosuccinate lyase
LEILMSKLWGGRFEEKTEKIVEDFSSSLSLDQRMWRDDIEGSLAHNSMLTKTKIISLEDGKMIQDALQQILSEIDSSLRDGKNPFNPDAEDIHSEIEARLFAKIGTVAGKLHTARSRNDQVATDLRLYLRRQIDELNADIQQLQKWIIETSELHLETILPGLTHMQHGQPVSLAHHLMAYFWMLERDRTRLEDCQKRMSVLPLGSAALAGTSFPIDREQVRAQLEFQRVSENSLDAVSDRDYVVEFLSAASTIMLHLSRWAEEIVLWSMPELQFIELADSVTTGSSIMPQKKNPDVSELIRGRTGRINGALMGILTVMKALPLSYQRDLQEDKYHLFEGLDSVRFCVKLMYCQMQKAQFRKEKMAVSLRGDASNATDLADYLAKKGLAFREAHEVVGRIVRYSIEQKLAIEDMSLAHLKEFHTFFEQEVLTAVKHIEVMKARNSFGGTGPKAVKVQINNAKNLFNKKRS